MMIPTFSVNADTYRPEVAKLVHDIDKYKNKNLDWLSEAYMKTVEGKETQGIRDFNAYSRQCERNAQLSRARTGDVPFLSQREIARGFKGISYDIGEDTEDIEEKVLKNLAIPVIVKKFLDMRENLYFDMGKDIWRLVELTLQKDRKANHSLKKVVELEPGLGELLEMVCSIQGVLKKLDEILN